MKTTVVIEEVDRQTFLRKNFQTEINRPVQHYETRYIPAEFIADISPKLRNGDSVNVILRKNDGSEFCGHVGLITTSSNGVVSFLDSTNPKSVGRPLLQYIQEQIEKNEEREVSGRNIFLGMKFLRLEDDPLGNLLEIDGPDAPMVTGPKGLINKMGKAD